MLRISPKIAVNVILYLMLIPGIITISYPKFSGDSRIELRDLQNFPPIPKNMTSLYSWTRKFDQFTSDRFPLRTEIITFVGRMMYPLKHSISPEVLIGQNGWLFLKKNSDVIEEHRGVSILSTNQVENWVQSYLQRKSEIESMDAKVYFVIVPNKHTVYPQYLPEHYFQIGRTPADQINDELKRRGVEGIIDLREVLKRKAKNHRIYFQHDSHMNDRGAYIAYQNIISSLSQFPALQAIENDDISFRMNVRADKSSRWYPWGDLSGLIRMKSLEDAPFAELAVSRVIKRSGFDHNNLTLSQVAISETNLMDAPRAVVFCDSFTVANLYKYLEQTFQQTIFKHHQFMSFQKDLIRKYKPDIVLYIVAERLIPHNLVN